MTTANQYLPENATIQYDQIVQVNISVGFGWRFYYANGESYITESQDDKQKLAVLVNGWTLQKDIKIDIYTKPAPVAAPAAEPQTPEFQTAVDNVWFENIRNASSISGSWNFHNYNKRADRFDYAWNLERHIANAIGRRELGYELSS